MNVLKVIIISKKKEKINLPYYSHFDHLLLVDGSKTNTYFNIKIINTSTIQCVRIIYINI